MNKFNKHYNGKRQLIILGNGFDLRCGLHTTYDNFFDDEFGITLVARSNYVLNKHKEYYDVLHQTRIKFQKAALTSLQKNFSGWLTSQDIKNWSQDFVQYFIAKQNVSHKIKEFENINNTATNKQSFKKTKAIIRKMVTKYQELHNLFSNSWLSLNLIASALITSNSEIKWNDVETMIYNIMTWVLKVRRETYWHFCVLSGKIDDRPNKVYAPVNKDLDKEFDKAFATLFRNYTFSPSVDPVKQEISEQILRKSIELCFPDSKNSYDEIATKALDELIPFERKFASFINKQTGTFPSDTLKEQRYFRSASYLLRKIIYPNIQGIYFSKDAQTIIDVINFNYSLDERFLPTLIEDFDPTANLKINSWSNIHGLACWNVNSAVRKISELHGRVGSNNYLRLPAPIFGIDNHGILSPDNREANNQDIDLNDPRSIFTKSYRLLDSHINDIRYHNLQPKVDVITFFGHSLSHADFSYFESIFDLYGITNNDNKVRLEFYYYPGDPKNKSKDEIKVQAKTQERKAIKNVVKLLTSYGENQGIKGGENIVNRLVLEKRLSILPYPND